MLIVAVFAETDLVPQGGILDAGAKDGQESCLYASYNPGRQVLAVEPLNENVRAIREQFSPHLPNLQIYVGGLGNATSTVSLPVAAGAKQQLNANDFAKAGTAQSADVETTTIQISRVDDIYASPTSPLAFAHWDVEGLELSVVAGATRTLLRDSPIFTVEVYPHSKHDLTLRVLSYIHKLDYATFLVEEICGRPCAQSNPTP
jgi:FkbM family methyltransferase